MSDSSEDVTIVTSTTEYFTDNDEMVTDEVTALITADGNVLATDELVTVEDADGSTAFDESLSLLTEDGELAIVAETAGMLDARGNAVLIELEPDDAADEPAAADDDS